MRIARRAALLVALGLVMTLALAPAGVDWRGAAADSVASGQTALVARPGGLQEAAARLERDQGRESLTLPRGAKHPLVLFALVALLLAVSGLAIQRARRSREPRPALAGWRVRSGGRAPPRFQLSVV